MPNPFLPTSPYFRSSTASLSSSPTQAVPIPFARNRTMPSPPRSPADLSPSTSPSSSPSHSSPLQGDIFGFMNDEAEPWSDDWFDSGDNTIRPRHHARPSMRAAMEWPDPNEPLFGADGSSRVSDLLSSLSLPTSPLFAYSVPTAGSGFSPTGTPALSPEGHDGHPISPPSTGISDGFSQLALFEDSLFDDMPPLEDASQPFSSFGCGAREQLMHQLHLSDALRGLTHVDLTAQLNDPSFVALFTSADCAAPETISMPPLSPSPEPEPLDDAEDDYASEEEYSPSLPSSPASSHSARSHSQSSSPRPTRRPAKIPLPVPVPNLTKKSRGRHVPTLALPDSPQPTYRPSSSAAREAARAAAEALASNEWRTSTGVKGRTYLCKIQGCGKVFQRGEHLKRHVRSIHTHDKPHMCPQDGCGKLFSRYDNLCQHMRVHRKSPSRGGSR